MIEQHQHQHLQQHQNAPPSSPSIETRRPRTASFMRRLKLGGGVLQSQDGTITSSVSSGSQQSLHKSTLLRLTCSFADYEYQYSIDQMDELSSGYVARHKPTGMNVVMKLTNLAASTTYDLWQEAQETIWNTMLCKHENILQYWQSFVDDEERLWVITEPVRVGSVRRLMDEHFQNGLQNEIIVATILRDLLCAVQYMHDKNYIHNNIRCEHVLLDTTGTVKLTGLGQMLQRQSMGKMQRSVYKFCGDPEWMAPEVLSQATTYNEKADIYSIGITAIEMLYGKTPFHQWPALKILLCKLYYQVPINPPPLAGGVPISIREGSKQFTEFVERCLHRDPSLRPSTTMLLEDPFMKHARNSHYLDTQFLRKHNRISAASTMSSNTNQASSSIHSHKHAGSPASEEGPNYMVSSSLGSFPTLEESSAE